MRVRRQKPKNFPEAALQRACVDLLAVYEAQGWLTYFAVLNNPRNAAHGRNQKLMGLRAGMTDLCIVINRGQVLFCELKAGTKLSPAQKDWRDLLQAFGHPWFLIESVDDLVAALVRYMKPKTGGK